MAIDKVKKNICVGCGACSQICPQKCIDLKEDESGFVYPNIKHDKCVECGLCEKVCHVLKNNQKEMRVHDSFEKEVYAAWSKNEDVRWKSTSGGAFSEIAKSFVENGGYICGAEYETPKSVRHAIYNKIEGVERLRQSKYAQSIINDVYLKIESLLKANVKVLFCGTPCQVAGLKAFLRSEYDNLYCIDFICRGVNSPKAYRMWVTEQEQKYKKEINRVWFKYKSDGWKKSPVVTRVDFKDNRSKIIKGNKNTFMIGYLSLNLFIRPSCGNCLYKGGNNVSDITLADFWGIEAELDDDKGTSMLIVNSSKGKKLIEMTKRNMEIFAKDDSDYFRNNVCAISSVNISEESSDFLNNVTENNFSKQIMNRYRKKRGNILQRVCRRILGGK